MEKTQYDQQMMQKQLKLEIMTIGFTHQKTEIKTADGTKPHQITCRTISRVPNEEGRYDQLLKELESIAQEFRISFEECLEKYESCSGCKKALRASLEKQSFTQWTELDDMALKLPEHSREF
jgi:hypothetical protein